MKSMTVSRIRAAVGIVAALGAMCNRVKVIDPAVFAAQQAKEGRHRRPLTGRGNYGKNLMAHFDRKRAEQKAAKQKQVELRKAA